jgi:hypothetical protein
MDPSALHEQKSRFPAAFLAGGIVVLLTVGGAYFLNRNFRSIGPAAEPPLPMTPVEQAYVPRIKFTDIQMARATNFLNQELTYVAAVLTNDGARPIRRVEVTIEFRDSLGQVVLRETRRVPGPYADAIAPGEHRDIQFTFEHLPTEWNRQYPVLRVTGLLLA